MTRLTLHDVDGATAALEKLVMCSTLSASTLMRVTRYSKWATTHGSAIRAAREVIGRQLGTPHPTIRGQWTISSLPDRIEFRNRMRVALSDPATVPRDLRPVPAADLIGAGLSAGELASLWFMIADWDWEPASGSTSSANAAASAPAPVAASSAPTVPTVPTMPTVPTSAPDELRSLSATIDSALRNSGSYASGGSFDSVEWDTSDSSDAAEVDDIGASASASAPASASASLPAAPGASASPSATPGAIELPGRQLAAAASTLTKLAGVHIPRATVEQPVPAASDPQLIAAILDLARWQYVLIQPLLIVQECLIAGGCAYGTLDEASGSYVIANKVAYERFVARTLDGTFSVAPPPPVPAAIVAHNVADIAPRDLITIDWMLDWSEDVSDAEDASDADSASESYWSASGSANSDGSDGSASDDSDDEIATKRERPESV